MENNKSTIFGEVREIVGNKLGIPNEEIYLNSSFINDLGADSLDMVEIIMDIEKKFAISINEEDITDINSVDDLVTYLFGRNDLKYFKDIVTSVKIPEGYSISLDKSNLKENKIVLEKTAITMNDILKEKWRPSQKYIQAHGRLLCLAHHFNTENKDLLKEDGKVYVINPYNMSINSIVYRSDATEGGIYFNSYSSASDALKIMGDEIKNLRYENL